MKINDIKSTHGVSVLVKNLEVRKTMIEAAVRVGFRKDSSTDTQVLDNRVIFLQIVPNGETFSICVDTEICQKASAVYNTYTAISIDDYLSLLEDENRLFNIGQFAVTAFDAKGFKVGCQQVTWEEYDKIGKSRPKE